MRRWNLLRDWDRHEASRVHNAARHSGGRMRSAPSPVVLGLLADLTTPRCGEFGLRAGQVAEPLARAYPRCLIRILEASMGPLEVMLFAGLAIPPGWADGFTLASKFECA